MAGRKAKLRIAYIILLFSFIGNSTAGQDERVQIPGALNKSYFEVNIGSIFYNFNTASLEAGYKMLSVRVPHTAVRIIPAGFEFNKYLSAQIFYMRPVLWVRYRYENGTDGSALTRSVWMNIAGVTVKPQLPIGKKVSLYGEGGLAIVTRKGFVDDEVNPVIRNANYSDLTLGGGLKYHLSDRWAFMFSAIWTPENKSAKQPAISFISAGFANKLVPFNGEKVKASLSSGCIFPKQMIQIGFTNNALGYGVNNFIAEGTVPLFWAGEAEISRGLSINYERNIFHGTKVFSLDWGVQASVWQSNEKREKFYTIAIYPVIKLTFLRTRLLDYYFYYSIAGPAYISKTEIDGKELGRHFTFQDNMGTGMFFGQKRTYNAEIRIGHYSNGDLFPMNEGVKIPLTFTVGYTFN